MAGDLDLTLLPFPVLTFNDVRIGDREGDPMMTVERFRARLDIPPLLGGDVQFDEIEFDAPRLAINIDDNGQLDWMLGARSAFTAADLPRIGLQNLSVRDGRVTFTDGRSGLQLQLTELNTTRVTARSLLGPWNIEGSVVAAGVPVAFRLATGTLQGDTVRVTSDFDVGPGSPLTGSLHADGAVTMATGELAYEGSFRQQRFDPPPDEETPPAILASSVGRFSLTSGAIAVSDFAWLPQGVAGVQEFVGEGVVQFGSAAGFDVRLSTRQIDVDRLLGEGPAAPIPLGEAFSRLARLPGGAPVLPLDGHLELSVPSVLIAGSVVQDFTLSAQHAGGAWLVDQLEAALPGQGRLAASGSLAIEPALEFTGEVALSTDQPGSFANWALGSHGSSALRSIGHLSIDANAELGPSALLLTDMRAMIDASPLTGSIQWRREGASGPLFRVSARAPSLPIGIVQGLNDLSGLRLPGPEGGEGEANLVLQVDEVTGADGTPLGMVDLDIVLDPRSLRFDRFTVGDLAGGRLTASGSIADPFGTPVGTLAATLQAEDLAPLTRILGVLAPRQEIVRWLAEGADRLSPAHLTGTLAVGNAPGLEIKLVGDLARTHLDGTFNLIGETAQPLETLASWREAEWSASLALDSPDAASLAEQAGFEVAPVGDVGPGSLRLSSGSAAGRASLTLNGSGVPAERISGTIAGSFAGLELNLGGEIGMPAGGAPSAALGVTASSEDIDPLLMMAGLVFPGVGFGNSLDLAGRLTLADGAASLAITNAELEGSAVAGTVTVKREPDAWRLDGAVELESLDLNWLAALELGTPIEAGPLAEGSVWDAETLGPPLIPQMRGDLAVKAGELSVSGSPLAIRDADLALHFQPDSLAAELRGGSAFGAGVTGMLSLRNNAGEAAVSGSLAMSGGELGSMVWREADLPVAEGPADLAFDFETTGRSVSGLWSNLAGGGSLDIAGGTVRHVDPAAFARIIEAADGGRLYTEEELIAELGEDFAEAEMAFDRASATFTIIGGALEASGVAVELAELDVTGNLDLDFNTLTLDSLWQVALADPAALVVGAPPEIDIGFSGAVAAPSRVVDVAALVAYLNLRALDREVKLLEDAEAAAGVAPPAAAPTPGEPFVATIPVVPPPSGAAEPVPSSADAAPAPP